MPVITTAITAGIYQHQWVGHVTADEVVNSVQRMQTLAHADNCDKYVAIIDASEVRTYPFNLAKLSRAFSGDTVSTLVYGAPATGQKLGEILGAMVKLSVEFYDDSDETLSRAHQLLEEHASTIFPE